MDAFKGIHALGTLFLVLLLIYSTYGMFENFFNGVSYTVFKYLLWGSYYLVIIVTALIVPATIAFGDEPETSIISALAGFGMYCLGALAMRIGTPFVEWAVNSGGTGTGFSMMLTENSTITATQGNQWVTVIWIIGALMFLIVLPTAAALIPSIYQKGATNQ